MLHRNLGLKLLALALAVVLWFALVVREDLDRRGANAPVAALTDYPLLGGEERYARAVPVVAQVEGPPAPGFELVSVWTQPSVVALVGPERRLRQMPVVPTQPILLADLRGEVNREVLLLLPDEVSVLGDPRVRVTLQVRPLAERVSTTGDE